MPVISMALFHPSHEKQNIIKFIESYVDAGIES